MALIRDVARLMSATQFGQRYNVVGLAEEFADALNAELDFLTEAHYTDQLRRNLSKAAGTTPNNWWCPILYWELTNSRLMTMNGWRACPC
jgi:ubiquinone biosynthesis protein